MTTVSLPEEISALFSDAHNNFPAIIVKTSNDDVQHLRRRNFAALQDIDLGNGTNATGLILSKDDHKAANRDKLFDQANGALEAYDPSIQDNNNNAVRLRREKKWSRNIDCQAAIRTSKHVGKKLVLSRMEEMWVVLLKEKTTLFKHVTIHNLLDHLLSRSMCGEDINVIGLQQGMLSWWVEEPRVLEFITRCEEAQRKSRRSSLTISDA